VSRPLLCRILFASGGVASALLAACTQEGAPTEPAPVASTSILAADAPPPQAAIPARFHGRWTLDLDDCGDFQSDGRLVITSRELAFHESRGTVISVSSEGDALTVSAEMSGEGETWEETYSFRLSPDRQALLQPVSDDDEGVRRLRCPTGTPR
jgi:hypothetical protein